MISIPDFYDPGPLRQIAINLFYGWGYNFYRAENQLRADDLLVRSKVGWLLGVARASIESAESAYRREFIPTPTREKPFADAKAVAGAQMIERLSRAIGALEGQIRALPVPENDRMTQRYRREADTLARLVDCDQTLVGQAELLRSTLDQKMGEWLIANVVALERATNAIAQTLRDRQAILLI
jgi:hypothetical protein